MPATVAMDAVFSNCRARPLRQHPCDLGLARPALLGASCVAGICGVMAITCAVMFGVMVGLSTGLQALGIQEAAAVELASWIVLIGMAFSLTPDSRFSRGCEKFMEVQIRILLGLAAGVMYTAKQAVGLTTAGVKGAITVVGAGTGALIGVAVGAYRATYFVAPAHDEPSCINLEKAMSHNRETIVHNIPIEDVPEARWFALRSGDKLFGFDSLELAKWYAMDAQRNDRDPGDLWWKNPHTQEGMTLDDCMALAMHSHEETRQILQPVLPTAVARRVRVSVDPQEDRWRRNPDVFDGRSHGELVCRHLFL